MARPGPYFRSKLCQLFGKTEQELGIGPSHSGLSTALSKPARAPSPARIARPALSDPALPPPPPCLVGRDDTLRHIKDALCSGQRRGLVLNGLPGVGKTALVRALAHDPEVWARFPDGVLWAGLGPTPDIQGQVSRWETLLGVISPETGSGAKEGQALRAAIGSRAILLVIDDVWTLEVALQLLVGGINCAYVITMRFRNIAAHFAFNEAMEVQALSEQQSLALLRRLARSVVEREPEKTLELVRAVGGLPLALTLMGNYLRTQTYSGHPRRIQTALKRLSDVKERLYLDEPHSVVEGYTSLPGETPLSLHAVITVTDRHVSEQARCALSMLSVFPAKPRSFSEEAALAVTGCSVDILDTLTDAGLLESTDSGRYLLHQVIADYARLQLTGATSTTANERLIAYVTAYVETHAREDDALVLENGMIFAALEAAYRSDKTAAFVRSMLACAPFLVLRGPCRMPLIEQYFRRALEIALNQADHATSTLFLLCLSGVTGKQGKVSQAQHYLREGLTGLRGLARSELGEHATEIISLCWTLSQEWHQPEPAEALLQEILALLPETGQEQRMRKSGCCCAGPASG